MKKQIFIPILIIIFLGLATTGVVLYGKGYQYDPTQGLIGTGILAASSNPEGAGVYINNHLQTATNNTVNLKPGSYDVMIKQDGYFPWEKTIAIQKGVVTKADARLFPTAPKLESITSTGIANPVIDPTFTKIAFVASPSGGVNKDVKKNGIFVLDMSNHQLLPLQSSSTQIADDTTDLFSTAALSWSPDGKQIVASISANRKIPTTYLLDATTLNQTPQDVTETMATVNSAWDKERLEKQTAQMNSLKPALRKIVNDNFTIIEWSPQPDETKILYQASASATIPQMITPAHIGRDTIPEERIIEKGNVYVYDIKEDQNFKILDAQTAEQELENGQVPIQWLPDGTHLLYTHDRKIDAMDYDGQNTITLWAGPFVDHFVFPWPDGNKIVILTNFNNDQILPNMYTIGLK
ncbi:MAG TPA: PEGA domain-containing protein [Candidatus Saccharimonadales bacterium]|nr:PEGA domain-containing protein [Candidatus Saccharimonadales bacterium]